MNVGLAGNIGQSLAYQVAECNYDYYVIELSSFQLDNMYKFHANIAVLMNITPDHLDRYDHQMQNYVDAKFRIIQNQTPDDAFIFWNDDPIIQRELHKYGIHGHYYPFAERKEEGTAAYVEQDKVYFTEPIAFNMEQEELALTGTHNLFNSMAAGISANLAGIRKECIREALGDFKGVEHRLEKVCRVRGVDYINDSKATNVNSCWYALQSMKTKTILILGGKDKGNDYNEIADLVKEKCTGLIYMGLHNEKLHDFFDKFGLPVADVQSMKDAVDAAYRDGQERRNRIIKSMLRQLRPFQKLRRPWRAVQGMCKNLYIVLRYIDNGSDKRLVQGRQSNLDYFPVSLSDLYRRGI